MLSNFQLIADHFGEKVIGQIANTNFFVYITNSYCLLRKAKIYWLADCSSKDMF